MHIFFLIWTIVVLNGVIVVDLQQNTPSAFLFFQLKWMTFPERAIYQKTIQMYKTLSGTAPNYLKIQYIYTFKNT